MPNPNEDHPIEEEEVGGDPNEDGDDAGDEGEDEGEGEPA